MKEQRCGETVGWSGRAEGQRDGGTDGQRDRGAEGQWDGVEGRRDRRTDGRTDGGKEDRMTRNTGEEEYKRRLWRKKLISTRLHPVGQVKKGYSKKMPFRN
jgi:hypothetical protein